MKPGKKSSVLPIRESKVTMEERTGTDRGTPSRVDFMQEIGAWYSAITSNIVRHPRIIRYGKDAAQHTTTARELEHRKDRDGPGLTLKKTSSRLRSPTKI
jgi:hypothetical protein